MCELAKVTDYRSYITADTRLDPSALLRIIKTSREVPIKDVLQQHVHFVVQLSNGTFV